MAKKFDKISPKNISEAKFNQLVDALPSSAVEPPPNLVAKPEQKETAVKVKRKKEKINKRERFRTQKLRIHKRSTDSGPYY